MDPDSRNLEEEEMLEHIILTGDGHEDTSQYLNLEGNDDDDS